MLEPAGTFLTTLLQLPNSDPVGFQSLGRGVVSAKCTEQYWSLARTSLEYRWQTGQSLLEPCCKVAEILLEHCQNSPGTFLHGSLVIPETLLESHWNIAGNLLEPGEPFLEHGETLLEPCCWILWLEHLGTNAGVDFVFLFTLFLALLNVPSCETGSLA